MTRKKVAWILVPVLGLAGVALLESLRSRPGEVVVDVGSGVSQSEPALGREAESVVGVDRKLGRVARDTPWRLEAIGKLDRMANPSPVTKNGR